MAKTRIEVNITRYETAAWEFDGILTEDQAIELVRVRVAKPIWREIHDKELDGIEITIDPGADAL
jgi:hypothetical protein